MKRAFLLLPMLALVASCQGSSEQGDAQIERNIEIDTQKDNAAFQATYDNCKKQMKDHSLDPIRNKIDLLGAIFVDNRPPPLAVLDNNGTPTAQEKAAILTWTAIVDACNDRMYNYELHPYDPSTINKNLRDKIISIGRWEDQQTRTLVASLYNGKINYSQFATKQGVINDIFSTAQQFLQDNDTFTAQEVIAKASDQISITDSPISSPSSEQPGTDGKNEIKLEDHGGTYTLPVHINGAITIDFVLDSGASDVLIPADVFTTLVRTGTVSEKDLIGKGSSTLADGSQVPSYIFVLRELKVGGHVVTDVTASIGPAASTPLLGQSYLSKFKSWTLDNTRHTLLIVDKGSPSAAVNTP